jgi:hypothetical protein
MLTSKSKSRIAGLTLGKAVINAMSGQILTAEFALVRDDGEFSGLLERRMGWSEKTMKALADLQAAMEEETLDHVFEDQPASDSAAEPEQV